jgi:hypothetical protein
MPIQRPDAQALYSMFLASLLWMYTLGENNGSGAARLASFRLTKSFHFNAALELFLHNDHSI